MSTEVERLRGANERLSTNLEEAKATCVELDLRLQAALKSKETDASAAAAREEVLRAEVEQARTRADTMSQSLAEVYMPVNCEALGLGATGEDRPIWGSARRGES